MSPNFRCPVCMTLMQAFYRRCRHGVRAVYTCQNRDCAQKGPVAYGKTVDEASFNATLTTNIWLWNIKEERRKPPVKDYKIMERTNHEPMTLNDYQRLAQLTSSDNPGIFPNVAAKKIDNGVLGMAGEGGECADIWKKYLHQGHPFDREKMIKEAGDVLWYIAELAAGLGLTLEEIATRNIEKLRNRYPDGHFDAERSIHREGTED